MTGKTNSYSENISGNKLLYHLDRVQGIRAPITADVFINNYCNNRCPYCTYKRWEHEAGARYMDLGDFSMYAARLYEMGVKGVILTGGGEPTLNPDFQGITQWLDKAQMAYGINTNFNVYRECRPEYLKVSLDAYDEDSYEALRGVRMYEQVCENIERYAAWKAVHSPKTSLGIQVVAIDADTVNRFYMENEHLPVDYIVFRPMESTGGEYYGENDAVRVKELIKAVHMWKEKDKRVVLNYKFFQLGVKTPSCVANWAQIAIDEKGQVMYCCHKPYEIVGHIMDDDILAKKAAFKTDMSMCDVPCRMTDNNLFMQRIEAGTKNPFFI